MRYAIFLGCTVPARLKHYEVSSRAILEKMDIELVDIPEFICCGYPLRNFDFMSFLLSSARNLALAKRDGLDIITLCKCCFGSLKKAEYFLKNEPALRREINDILNKENLNLDGSIVIKHILSVLYHDIGIDALKEMITKPYNDVKIATHYGCHALRPSEVVQFDDPANPSIFDQLVEVTGAKSIHWHSRLECCGAPVMGINDNLSMDITEKKLIDGQESGADYLCVACSYCQLQFDKVQKIMVSDRNIDNSLSSILYPQLLGLSMGIDAETLQLGMNELDITELQNCI